MILLKVSVSNLGPGSQFGAFLGFREKNNPINSLVFIVKYSIVYLCICVLLEVFADNVMFQGLIWRIQLLRPVLKLVMMGLTTFRILMIWR